MEEYDGENVEMLREELARIAGQHEPHINVMATGEASDTESNDPVPEDDAE